MGTVSLVKLTDGEIASIRSARSVGLSPEYYNNSYVYRIDGGWYGFQGDLYHTEGTPYIQCQLHSGFSVEEPEDFFEDW